MVMSVPRLESSISIAGARRALARIFAAAGLDTPALDARVLAGHALGLDHAALVAAGERVLDSEERDCIAAMAARAGSGPPPAAITSTRCPIRSSMIDGNRSYRPSAQRYSIVKF